jgi:hypothetical protein
LVALEGDGRLRFALRQILKLQGKLSEKLLSRVTESAPVQGTRGRWLLNDFTRDLLHGPSSLAQDLFGVAGVERLLREQETKRRHSETLARLIAAEEFRRLTLRCRPADSPAGL